jgi:hypothetical protein
MSSVRRDAWPVVRGCAALAAGVPRAVIVTVLGAAVVLAQAASTAWSRVRGVVAAETEPPRHHAGRVSEQVKAAERAARAAGVLRSRPRPL